MNLFGISLCAKFKVEIIFLKLASPFILNLFISDFRRLSTRLLKSALYTIKVLQKEVGKLHEKASLFAILIERYHILNKWLRICLIPLSRIEKSCMSLLRMMRL